MFKERQALNRNMFLSLSTEVLFSLKIGDVRMEDILINDVAIRSRVHEHTICGN